MTTLASLGLDSRRFSISRDDAGREYGVRTEGDPKNLHMKMLFARARREGIRVEKERW
jgi:hypothetical protein